MLSLREEVHDGASSMEPLALVSLSRGTTGIVRAPEVLDITNTSAY